LFQEESAMPSRRDAARMSPEELRAYLEEQRRIIVVSNGPLGLPHPVPMNYGVDNEGRVVISTFRKSQKVKNLERDPRATLLVESGERYAELKSAILYCHAEIIGDPEGVAANMALVRADDAMAGSLDSAMSEQVRASMAKRVIVRFTLFRTVSWDHGKLGGYY
jgi:nitroimidazol reductase NimA-like FMN-containing flavoprotein (pyridoxamine 5'-phosphate oxidase superfamily)